MSKTQIRTALFTGSSGIVVVALLFLLIVNFNQSEELRRIFLGYMAALLFFSVAAFAVFFYKGAIFKISGELDDSLVTTVILTVLIVAQIAFAFANYAYRQIHNSFETFDNVRSIYNKTDWNTGHAGLDAQLGTLPKTIDFVYIMSPSGRMAYHYGSIPEGSRIVSGRNNLRKDIKINLKPNERYVFPFKGGVIGMHISRSYQLTMMRNILIDLSTLIVTGLFFGFELILFVMRRIKRKIAEADAVADAAANELPNTGFVYIRQLAFFFYFGSQMAASFIPVLASTLAGTGTKSSGIASGIPQSVETLLTCTAIFLTSELIIKKGWRLPFLFGLAFVILGNFLSGTAESLPFFIMARAVVGLGYGFCWMTLRNLTLFGRDEAERDYGFALLNAGIYAGINCGSVAGSILAESLGFKNVFFIAAGMTALCVLAVLSLQNARIPLPQAKQETRDPSGAGRNTSGGYIQLACFLLLMILPVCVMDSYIEYFLPIYTVNIGYRTADVGRAQLLYGLIIVFFAPKLMLIVRKRIKNSANIIILYILLLASALTLTGIAGGYGIVLAALLLIGIGDGFGISAQNSYFFALPAMARLPKSRAFSYLSFFKKLAVMAGPITFAIAMAIPNRKGILFMGILFFVIAFLAARMKAGHGPAPKEG